MCLQVLQVSGAEINVNYCPGLNDTLRTINDVLEKEDVLTDNGMSIRSEIIAAGLRIAQRIKVVI